MDLNTQMNLAMGLAVLRGCRQRVWRDAAGVWWSTDLPEPLTPVDEPCS